MKLSRLTNSQLRSILRRGEVRFADEKFTKKQKLITDLINQFRFCGLENDRAKNKILYFYEKLFTKKYFPVGLERFPKDVQEVINASKKAQELSFKCITTLEKYLQQMK